MNIDGRTSEIEEDILPNLVKALNEAPRDYTLRAKLVSAMGELGFRNHAITAALRVADDLVLQGHILPALWVLCDSKHYHGLSSPFIQEKLQLLHAESSASEETLMEEMFLEPTPLKRNTIANLDPEVLRKLSIEEQVGQVVDFLAEPAIDSCRGIAFPMPLFSEMACAQFMSAAPHLTCHEAAEGSTIIKAGDDANSVLIIVHGEVNVTRAGKRVARLGAGSVIGEMALFTRSTRRADVVATSPVSYVELQGADALQLCAESPEFEDELRRFCNNRMIQNLIRTSELFSHFDLGTASLLAHSFTQQTFVAGDVLVPYGEPGKGLWLTANGTVDVKIPNQMDRMTKVATLGEGDIFGEISLITSLPTTAQVVAATSGWAMFLDKADFQALLADHPEVAEYVNELGRKRVVEQKQADKFKPIVVKSEQQEEIFSVPLPGATVQPSKRLN